ncbi:MAG: GNAT family N-acyltransferase, partial [Pseudomonadota bacterium]
KNAMNQIAARGKVRSLLPKLRAYSGIRVRTARSNFAETLGALGPLEVRLAKKAHEVRSAQRLRYNVFYKEMSAIPAATTLIARRDVDAFDTICDHLNVVDHDWPRLVFVPHASVQRLNLEWNAPTLWKAADKAEPLPRPEKMPYPVGWVMWRQELQINFRSQSVDEAFALDGLLRGENFGALCEGLTEWIDAQNVAVHAAGLLKQWLTDGLIKEIKTG